MDWKKTWFWMGVTALVFGLFWHIWHIFAGEIPAIRELTMSVGDEEEESAIWTLPFAVSHSWDMLAAPLFVLAFSWLQSRTEEGTDENDILVVGLVFGLGLGLVVGLVFGLVFGLGLGLGLGLVFGLSFGLSFGLGLGLVFGLGFGLGFGFNCGIFWTMPLGAVFGALVILPNTVLLIVLMGLREAIRGFSNSKAAPSEC